MTDTTIAQWVQLPMICVMGDTSSGKSSLLSQLSGIELPTHHQLTTRCPILLRMNSGRQATNGRDEPTIESVATVGVIWKSPTQDGSTWPTFSERTITSEHWETLPLVVREAQDFILQNTGRDVAPDIVSVEVRGSPHPSDLTLLDLPGLVRSHAVDESITLAEDVQRLVSDYLQQTQSVILVVHASTTDFHNSQILADAMKVDPDTRRTIPVLTKPDLIDPGAEQAVVDLLLGKKLQFKMGFHMVKGRGQTALDRRDTIAQGLEDERHFFDSTDPWKSIHDRSLFGTEHLRHKLSKLQVTMIRESLPGIVRQIRRQREEAASKLKEMGTIHTTVQDCRRYYHEMCMSLIHKLQSKLKGRCRQDGKPSAAAQMHEECGTFMQAIHDSPLGKIGSVVEGAAVLVATPRGDVRGEVVHLDDDFACVDYTDPTDSQSDALFEYVGVKSQNPIEEDEVWSDGSMVNIGRKNDSYDTLRKIPLYQIRTDPYWLQDKIKENRTDDLACFLNIDIFKSIVEDFIETDWRPQCIKLLDSTRDIVTSTLDVTVAEIFQTDRYPLLQTLVQKECNLAMQHIFEQAFTQLESQIRTEKHPYTQDKMMFENLNEARFRRLRRELEVTMRLDQERVYDSQAIKAMMDTVFERNQMKSVEEHMADEMETVLEIYGEIATRRAIDRFPMISWGLFRSLPDTIRDALWSVTDEVLMQCMQQTDSFITEHQALQEKLRQLDKAITIMESI